MLHYLTSRGARIGSMDDALIELPRLLRAAREHMQLTGPSRGNYPRDRVIVAGWSDAKARVIAAERALADLEDRAGAREHGPGQRQCERLRGRHEHDHGRHRRVRHGAAPTGHAHQATRQHAADRTARQPISVLILCVWRM